MATGYRLISAVHTGDLKGVKDLVTAFGLYYSPAWLEGYALLIDALKHKHKEIAKVLLAHGSKVNLKRKTFKDTPLHFAVKNGDLEIIELLLDKGANVLAKDSESLTSFHLAALRKEDGNKIIKLLSKKQSNVNPLGINDKTPLHMAVEAGYSEIVKCLLDLGASVSATCKSTFGEGCTALHLLVERGLCSGEDIGISLLNKGADINAQTENGATPLHIAASKGCIQIIQHLLKHKVDVNASTYKDDLSPIHIAIEAEHEKVVDLLLEHGANVDLESPKGKTVLHVAVEKGNPCIVKSILNYHPEVKKEGNRYALYAAICGDRAKGEIINVLCRYGFKLTELEMKNYEVLLGAVEKGCFQIVKDILKLGALNINFLHESKVKSLLRSGAPLHIAAKNKQSKIVKLLINHGADINLKDQTGKTPLFYATQAGDGDSVDQLLAKGAEAKDPKLLFTALEKKELHIVRVLLKNEIDVNTPDSYGRWPLHAAVSHHQIIVENCELNDDIFLDCQEDLARAVLSRGADPNATSMDGRTALHMAAEKNYDGAVEALLEYGAEPNVQDKRGNTPLHMAVPDGHAEVVETLLEYGADPNLKNHEGQTPLHLSAKSNNEFVLIKLLDYGGNIDILDNDGSSPLDFVKTRPTCQCMEDDGDDDCECDYLFSDDIYEVLNQYIIVLKTANLPVSEHNLELHNLNYDDFSDKASDCEFEVNFMKMKKISNNVTLYDILTKNVSQLAIYARNDEIIEALKKDYSDDIPAYASLIENAFERGVQRNRLMKKHSEFFNAIFSNLPVICKEKIFSYLNNKELKKFIDAMNPTRHECFSSRSNKTDSSGSNKNFKLIRPKIRKCHTMDEVLA